MAVRLRRPSDGIPRATASQDAPSIAQPPLDPALPDVFALGEPALAPRSWAMLLGLDADLPADVFGIAPAPAPSSRSSSATPRSSDASGPASSRPAVTTSKPFAVKVSPAAEGARLSAEVGMPTPPLNGGGRRRRREDDAQILETGAIVDKYRIEELIGTGGFAHVYRATNLALGAPVAIKMLRTKSVRPEVEQQLVDEARNAARIDHPNVVRVMDVSQTAAATYIVMEYIDGETLAAAIVRRGRLPPSDVARLGLDIARGLAAGLERGLVHRDIKPANILVHRNGSAKIVDLGLARRSNAGDVRDGKRRGVAGTPGYIAPELYFDPGLADFRSDIYALGVTLYEAVIGRPPFPADDAESNKQQHLNDVPPPAHELASDIPMSFSRLLSWMLAKDPSQRPFSYARLIEGFEQVLADLEAIARRMRAPNTRRKRVRTLPR